MSIPADIIVRPVASRREDPIFGVRTPGDTDHGTMEDVAKAANPLHYVPFVSQVYEAATGNTGSAAMKLIGGAVLGGPIGFLVGLASTIFEQESGKTIVASIADAITGNESATQVASAQVPEAGEQVASLRGVNAETQEITHPTQEIIPPSQQISALDAQDAAQKARQQMAAMTANIGNPASISDEQVLDLFGGQPASAHKSYQKAQMLPYLKDVTTSQVI